MSYTASHKNVALAQDNCVKIPVHDTVSARTSLLDLGIKPREVHAIFEEQRLTCSGEVLKRNDMLSPGMMLELRLACSHIDLPDTEAPACQVVYEDGIVLACDKQAGILVHSDGNDVPRLPTQFRHILQTKAFIGAHRLCNALMFLPRVWCSSRQRASFNLLWMSRWLRGRCINDILR